jgi:hypothetical protein
MRNLLTIPILALYSLGLTGQSTDTLPAFQLTYGLTVWQPGLYVSPYFQDAITANYNPGISLNVEARVGRGLSWIGTVGTEKRTDRAIYGTDLPLPVTRPPGSDGGDVIPRWFMAVNRQWRRYYLGLGGQVNLRIGRGDLSLQLTGNFGPDFFRDVVSAGDLELRRRGTQVLPPRGLFGSATLHYGPVWQTGARSQLAYAYWVDQRFAIQLGAYISVRGGLTLGKEVRGDVPRYQLRKIEFTDDIRPAVDNYLLPLREDLPPVDPTEELWETGLSLGFIYKPR